MTTPHTAGITGSTPGGTMPVKDIIESSGAEENEQEKPAGTPAPDETGAGEGTEEGGSAPPSVDDDTEIELEGGERVTLKELRAGYSRQADYTRKTQEVAREKERLADMAAFSEYLDNPEVPAFEKVKLIADQLGVSVAEAKKIQEGLENAPPDEESGLDPDDPRDKVILDLQRKQQEIENAQARERVASAHREIEREISQAQEKYPDMSQEDLDSILRIVQGGGSKENIAKAADAYFERLEKYGKAAVKKYVEGKTANPRVPLPTGGVAPGQAEKKLSLEDGSAKRSFAESIRTATGAAND